MKNMSDYISTAEGVNQMWDKINKVLDNFDFDKVAGIIQEALEPWECTENAAEKMRESGIASRVFADGLHYYPSGKQAAIEARNLLLNAIEGMPDDESERVATWKGFLATATIHDKDKVYGKNSPDDFYHSVTLSLEFVVEKSIAVV